MIEVNDTDVGVIVEAALDVTLIAVVGRETSRADSLSKMSVPIETGSPCTDAWSRSINSSDNCSILP